MYMAPDPHDVLYENLAEDDINASSWKWLGPSDSNDLAHGMFPQEMEDFSIFLKTPMAHMALIWSFKDVIYKQRQTTSNNPTTRQIQPSLEQANEVT